MQANSSSFFNFAETSNGFLTGSIFPALRSTNALYGTWQPAAQRRFQKLVIPLNYVQNLLRIEASINGVNGNLILDTGAPKNTWMQKRFCSQALLTIGLIRVTKYTCKKKKMNGYFRSILNPANTFINLWWTANGSLIPATTAGKKMSTIQEILCFG